MKADSCYPVILCAYKVTLLLWNIGICKGYRIFNFSERNVNPLCYKPLEQFHVLHIIVRRLLRDVTSAGLNQVEPETY